MKKVIYGVLIVVTMVLSLCMCACTSGTNNNPTNDGKNEQNNPEITKIAITAPAKVEAGKSVQVAVKLTFSDGTTISKASFLSYEDLSLVITSGNQYCQVIDDNISVSDNAPDKLSVSFYVKNKNIKSNTLQLSVSNQKAVLQTQLQEYEEQKQELEKEVQNLVSQYNTTEQAYNKNQADYDNLTLQLVRNGCMTSGGSYKHFREEERTHQSLYEECDRLWRQMGKLYIAVGEKSDDLEAVKTKIKTIQEEIKKL